MFCADNYLIQYGTKIYFESSLGSLNSERDIKIMLLNISTFLSQQAMDFLIERLREGQWVHMFPEGKVNMSMERLRFKWGVGRLVYESPICPIVLPFYHIGMDSILPSRFPYIPRVGKTVTVVVGEPMDFKELVSEMKEQQEDPTKARKVITDKIQDELGKLRVRAEELHEKMLSEKNR